jgi:hypothetical protein
MFSLILFCDSFLISSFVFWSCNEILILIYKNKRILENVILYRISSCVVHNLWSEWKSTSRHSVISHNFILLSLTETFLKVLSACHLYFEILLIFSICLYLYAKRLRWLVSWFEVIVVACMKFCKFLLTRIKRKAVFLVWYHQNLQTHL